MDGLRAELRRVRGIAVPLVWAAMPFVVLACDRPAPGDTADTPRSYPPGYIVDSIHPPEEALRRFRLGLDTPSVLDGPRSRDDLYREFATALAKRDTAALSALVVNKAEYAFLVYPELRISQPPYRQPPEIAWMMSATATGGGMAKLLGRADRMQLLGYTCEQEPDREGTLRLWKDCVVSTQTAEGTRNLRLFGALIERNGRFKFAGLNNSL